MLRRSFVRIAAAVVVGAVLAPGCGSAVRSSAGSSGAGFQTRAEDVVRSFCSRFGRDRGSGIALLFVDSARVDIGGFGTALEGRTALRRLFGYGVASGSRLRPGEFRQESETLRCRISERNRWLTRLGLDSLYYDAGFVVSGARVAYVRLDVTRESLEVLKQRLAPLLVWLALHDPDAVARLLPGGRPKLDEATARELLEILQRWAARLR
jgi:hypothetical protein